MITGMQCRKANREKLGLECNFNLHFKQQHHHYPITAYRHGNPYSTAMYNLKLCACTLTTMTNLH